MSLGQYLIQLRKVKGELSAEQAFLIDNSLSQKLHTATKWSLRLRYSVSYSSKMKPHHRIHGSILNRMACWYALKNFFTLRLLTSGHYLAVTTRLHQEYSIFHISYLHLPSKSPSIYSWNTTACGWGNSIFRTKFRPQVTLKSIAAYPSFTLNIPIISPPLNLYQHTIYLSITPEILLFSSVNAIATPSLSLLCHNLH